VKTAQSNHINIRYCKILPHVKAGVRKSSDMLGHWVFKLLKLPEVFIQHIKIANTVRLKINLISSSAIGLFFTSCLSNIATDNHHMASECENEKAARVN
jgi:hypothetical protein